MSKLQTELMVQAPGRFRTAAECLLRGAMLERLRAGEDVRKPRVRRVRAALREHRYLNMLKVDVAAQRLADVMSEETK
jgi:hypothetical protein